MKNDKSLNDQSKLSSNEKTTNSFEKIINHASKELIKAVISDKLKRRGQKNENIGDCRSQCKFRTANTKETNS